MKTKTLLSLASLVLLTTVARAEYRTPTSNEVVVFPTYSVTAPRYTPAEQQINASLAELRQQAKTPIAVPVECAALKAAVNHDSRIALATPAMNVVRIAKS